jgi:hypothetical protein
MILSDPVFSSISICANVKGFVFASLSGARRGFMPSQSKTKQTKHKLKLIYFRWILASWIHCGSLPKVKCVPIGGHSSLNFPSALPNVCTQLLPVVKKGFSFGLGVELVKEWVLKSRPSFFCKSCIFVSLAESF